MTFKRVSGYCVGLFESLFLWCYIWYASLAYLFHNLFFFLAGENVVICRATDQKVFSRGAWKPSTIERMLDDVHHPYSPKRFPDWRNEPWNRVRCNRRYHDLSHKLFGLMTPEEITERLALYYRLVGRARTEAEALLCLEGDFWAEFVRKSGRVVVNRRKWKHVLYEHRKGYLLRQVFRYRRPESIKRWVHLFYILFTGMTESQAVYFLSKHLWPRQYSTSRVNPRGLNKRRQLPSRHRQSYMRH